MEDEEMMKVLMPDVKVISTTLTPPGGDDPIKIDGFYRSGETKSGNKWKRYLGINVEYKYNGYILLIHYDSYKYSRSKSKECRYTITDMKGLSSFKGSKVSEKEFDIIDDISASANAFVRYINLITYRRQK